MGPLSLLELKKAKHWPPTRARVTGSPPRKRRGPRRYRRSSPALAPVPSRCLARRRLGGAIAVTLRRRQRACGQQGDFVSSSWQPWEGSQTLPAMGSRWAKPRSVHAVVAVAIACVTLGPARRAAAVIPALEESATSRSTRSSKARSRAQALPPPRRAAGARAERQSAVRRTSSPAGTCFTVLRSVGPRAGSRVQRAARHLDGAGDRFSLGYAAADPVRRRQPGVQRRGGAGRRQDLFASYAFARRERVGLEAEVAVSWLSGRRSREVGTKRPPLLLFGARSSRATATLAFLYPEYIAGVRSPHSRAGGLRRSAPFGQALRFRNGLELELRTRRGNEEILQPGRIAVLRDDMFDALATATLYCAPSTTCTVHAA